jgi:FtsH-binding integral membrane protein
VAAVAALGIALFPCQCGSHTVVPYIHGASAAVMFLMLAYFCLVFYRTAQRKKKEHPKAGVRAGLYALCGGVILLSVAVLAFDYMTGDSLTKRIPRFVFYGESAALIFFSVSWLTASRTIPWVLTDEKERFSPLREHNPE